jgi:hypothetical protein
MALWGNKDTFSSLTGTVSVDYSTKVVTGSGTTFVTAGISTGDVISIGAGNTFGQAVISGVTSATQLSIASTAFLSGDAISGIAYTVSQEPIYTLGVGETARGTVGGASLVYGVDQTEVGVARTADVTFGVTKSGGYGVAHSGWVSVASTYIDSNNRLRVKSEVLVAMGGTMGANDALDDDIFADS